MILIIDGYNYAKFLFGPDYSRQSVYHKKFLQTLHIYEQRKNGAVALQVVFDGGPGVYPEYDVEYGVATVAAGYQKCADNFIVGRCEQLSGRECVVVTNDRTLAARCRNEGAYTFLVADFYRLLKAVVETEEVRKQTTGVHTHKTSTADNDELDQLMFADTSLYEKDESSEEEWVGPQQKKSKKERERERYERKLG